MAERYTGWEVEEVRMKRRFASDKEVSLSKRRHTLPSPVSAAGITPINNPSKHVTRSSPSQPFSKKPLVEQHHSLGDSEADSSRFGSCTSPLANMLEEQKPRSRKLSAPTSRHSKGSSHKSPKKSKQGPSKCVPNRTLAKSPMLVLSPKFMSGYWSTSDNNLRDRQERVQDSLPTVSICAEIVKKPELFRHSPIGLNVETLRMNANSHSELPTTLDALKQSGTSGLTLYNVSPCFTNSHSSTQDSSLGSTHMSTPIRPTVESILEEKSSWSSRPRYDLNCQSIELSSRPDQIAVSSFADVASVSELTQISNEVADEELLALGVASSPTPPRPKSEGLSSNITSEKPFLDHRISFVSLGASSAPLSSSDRPVMNNDQPPGTDDEWIALGDEEELLLRDWDEVVSDTNPADAQDPTDPDPQEIVAEEYDNTILRLPIARPPFPAPVRDRSPIMGVSASNYLRTCFRIGEALNEGCQAARCNKDVTIELYAKVNSSWRESAGGKQHFLFTDLFHDRAPRIEGVYNRWKENELWAHDSSQFLSAKGGKRLCRCIGKMKREKSVWMITVLNIWEATWDDVEHVRGIACACSNLDLAQNAEVSDFMRHP